MRSAQLIVAALAVVTQAACITTALGRGPTDRDLENDGSTDGQLDLYRAYEISYEQSAFKRPGADPVEVAKEAGLTRVDATLAQAWSDDAYNYLSTSRRAAEVMDHPAIAFDGFAHSGMGETVLVGVGLGGGLLAGAVAWFAATTVRDGVSEAESADLFVSSSTGLFIGTSLGVIIAAAYTYIVPNVSTPFAVPLYRKAAQAFNEDLEDRILENSPQGDAPPLDSGEPGDSGADNADKADSADDAHGHDHGDGQPHDHDHDHAADGDYSHDHEPHPIPVPTPGAEG